MKLPYAHINAFADRPFAGNQAAVMPLDEWLPDEILQAIGEENNFAETAFLVPDTGGEADYQLRWFTPEVEIALCGHATLASGHYILSQNSDMDMLRFSTRQAGILEMRRMPDMGDDTYALALPAYTPCRAGWADWTPFLGAEPLERHFHESRFHVLLFENAHDVLKLRPDFAELKKIGNDQFICTAPGDGHESGADIVSRVFVPGGGIDEDSVTGSAHAVLTPFWTDRLGRDSFTAYQASQRGGMLGCRMDGEQVWLSGQCVTVVEGSFTLPRH